MTRTIPVTPDNWFDLERLAAAEPDGVALAPVLHDAAGGVPLSSAHVEDLGAVYFTLVARGATWPGPDSRLDDSAVDRLVADLGALVVARAYAAISAGIDDGSALRGPGLAHPTLADDGCALAFWRAFLRVRGGTTLPAWVGSVAEDGDVAPHLHAKAWLRLLFQKVGAERQTPAVLDALHRTYTPDVRAGLRDADRQLRTAQGLTWCAWWGDALGLDAPARTAPAIPRCHRHAGRSSASPSVTVVVPSYNHGPFVQAALESVLAQTHHDLTLLVVDDCSTDDTVARARAIDDPRLRVSVNPANLGLGDSVNAALAHVDTPFVALLNSDDVFHPERLARCLEVLADDAVAQVVATGVVPMDAAGHALGPDVVSPVYDGHQIADWVRWFTDRCRVPPSADLVAELLERNFLITSSNLVARTPFLRQHHQAFHALKYCLDWQVFLDGAIDGVLRVVDAPLLGYRLHRTNTVWFDARRLVEYRVEVNRVLASALERLRARASASGSHGLAIEHALRHAARHSDADGFLAFASAQFGDTAVAETIARSESLSAAVRERPGTGVAPRSAEEFRRLELHAAAAEILADVARTAERRTTATADAALAGALTSLETERLAHLETQEHLQAERRNLAELQRRAQAERAELEARAAAQASAHAEALTALRGSPEWLLGDRLWNRLRLSRIGRPAVGALHAARDLRNRGSLALRGLARRAGLRRPGAVVAACWSFPIHSQTFVYQEMQALAWTGLDCDVFCCDTNPRTELPAAFAGLWPKRVVMQTDWARGQADLAHFRRTRPDRVASLLALLAGATGRTESALLDESIVLTGFTFARHLELARTRYVHTYFFYDQSFLALMAAHLLQIPRGITAYADHMLGDYAFKLVPLHLALADVVVATSARIKQELGEIGGGRVDDKIIVKPNGIDVARFPHVPAAVRRASLATPELVAVNRIEPKKGLVHLVEAVGLLRDRGLPVVANIVGGVDANTATSAACHRELVARIEALGLGEAVVLHGVKQQHEFAPIAARSHLFVAPYVEVGSGDKDGIPTAVLEAMSTGLPIVATDAGSIAEAARDGIEALIVPQRDAVALAEAIARLLGDAATYACMADAARARAVNEFDIHVTERRLHERVARLIGRP